jgi:hypothetical protein
MYPQQLFGQGFNNFQGFNPYGGFGGFSLMPSPGLFGGFNPYNDLFSGFQTKLDDLFKNYQTQIGQNVATQQQPVVSENSANPQEILKKKPATQKPLQMKGKDGKTYSNMPTPTGANSLIAKYNLQPKSGMNTDGAIRAPRMQPNTQYRPQSTSWVAR